ncbi:UNVERIFIED_CONTAM: tRNA methyltransferase 10 [Siphonaria sp. JEL0065]|nr:tRNA methyltransferase 10 [Siphonaria sp. JEL0065]
MKESLDKTQKDWKLWKLDIHEKPLLEAIPDTENIVYLTADSTTVLEDLDETKAYVIGGIVDKNRYKNLCLNRAEAAGLKTAQLPIGEYIKMSSRKVLTVNQVLEIMAKYLETKDWKAAFLHVIPQRKITPKERKRGGKKGEGDVDGEGDSEGDEDEDDGGNGGGEGGDEEVEDKGGEQEKGEQETKEDE